MVSKLHWLFWKTRWLILGKYRRISFVVTALASAMIFTWFCVEQYLSYAKPDEPRLAWFNFVVQLVLFIVCALISYATQPKQKDTMQAGTPEAPTIEEGAGILTVWGDVWLDSPTITHWKNWQACAIKKDKQTIGYEYYYYWCFGLCRKADALLEIRGGGSTVWQGSITTDNAWRTEKGDLWGGREREGGVVAMWRMHFGESNQPKDDWKTEHWGADQSAYRGKVMLNFAGIWGTSPYPKEASFKVRRVPSEWYPEKANIGAEEGQVIEGTTGFTTSSVAEYPLEVRTGETETDFNADAIGSDGTSIKNLWNGTSSSAQKCRRLHNLLDIPFAGKVNKCEFDMKMTERGTVEGLQIFFIWYNQNSEQVYQYEIDTCATASSYKCAIRGNLNLWKPLFLPTVGEWYHVTIDSSHDGDGFSDPWVVTVTDSNGTQVAQESYVGFAQTSSTKISVRFYQETSLSSASNKTSAEIKNIVLTGDLPHGYCNPAHILRETLVSPDMLGEASANIDDTAFTAAADTLYDEGFGLCTSWNPASESIQDFQGKICDLIDGNLSRDRTTGKWRLDLMRGAGTLSSLPALTDDNIIEWNEQPATLDDAINQLAVKWHDPIEHEDRTTSPQQMLGLIQSFGGVVSDTLDCPEIPTEALAYQVAINKLRQKSRPVRRFELVTDRTPYAWHVGQYFNLQARGMNIACMVGEIDTRTLTQGSVSLTAVEDVWTAGTQVFNHAQLPSDTPSEAEDAPYQAAIEMPYVIARTQMPSADLADVTSGGYLLTAASQPDGGMNYKIFDGDTYVTDGSFVAGAKASGTASATSITLSDVIGEPVIGCPALWGDELCRLDAMSGTTATLGRGCGDTIPVAHSNEQILFLGTIEGDWSQVWSGAHTIKLPTRANGVDLALSDATSHAITFGNRLMLPYPPAGLEATITGDTLLTVTWANRNRLTQGGDLIDQTAASVAGETGQTTTVTVLDDEETVVDTQTGLTGTSTTFTLPAPTPVSGNYPQEVITDTPRVYYRLNDAAGSTTVADSSGNNYSGSSSGFTFGQPAILVGETDTCAVTAQLNTRIFVTGSAVSAWCFPSCTLEVVIKLTADQTQNHCWMVTNASQSGVFNVGLLMSNYGYPRLLAHSGSTYPDVQHNEKLTLNTPHHLAGVVRSLTDGAALELYIDGVMVGSQTITSNLYSGAYGWTVGGCVNSSSADSKAMQGYYSDAAIYDHALSSSRIAAHAAAALTGGGGGGGDDTFIIQAKSVRDGLDSLFTNSISITRS